MGFQAPKLKPLKRFRGFLKKPVLNSSAHPKAGRVFGGKLSFCETNYIFRNKFNELVFLLQQTFYTK